MMSICDKHNEPRVEWAGKLKCKSCNREYQQSGGTKTSILNDNVAKTTDCACASQLDSGYLTF